MTHLDLTPCARACLAMLAARDMSSYELLVQLPMRAEGGREEGKERGRVGGEEGWKERRK